MTLLLLTSGILHTTSTLPTSCRHDLSHDMYLRTVFVSEGTICICFCEEPLRREWRGSLRSERDGPCNCRNSTRESGWLLVPCLCPLKVSDARVSRMSPRFWDEEYLPTRSLFWSKPVLVWGSLPASTLIFALLYLPLP